LAGFWRIALHTKRPHRQLKGHPARSADLQVAPFGQELSGLRLALFIAEQKKIVNSTHPTELLLSTENHHVTMHY
jgi:hypothetical protein